MPKIDNLIKCTVQRSPKMTKVVLYTGVASYAPKTAGHPALLARWQPIVRGDPLFTFLNVKLWLYSVQASTPRRGHKDELYNLHLHHTAPTFVKQFFGVTTVTHHSLTHNEDFRGKYQVTYFEMWTSWIVFKSRCGFIPIFD